MSTFLDLTVDVVALQENGELGTKGLRKQGTKLLYVREVPYPNVDGLPFVVAGVGLVLPVRTSCDDNRAIIRQGQEGGEHPTEGKRVDLELDPILNVKTYHYGTRGRSLLQSGSAVL